MTLLGRSAAAALVTVVTSAALVTVPAHASGGTRVVDAAPTSRVTSTGLQLTFLTSVAVDRAGYRYATDGWFNLYVYGPRAKGETAPTRVVPFHRPHSVTFDRAGYAYVALGPCEVAIPGIDCAPPSAGSISVYAPGKLGVAPPVRRIVGTATGLDAPSDIAVTPDGWIYTTNHASGSVTVHRTSDRGNAAPKRVIAGPRTRLERVTDAAVPHAAAQEVAVGRDGRVYVGTAGSDPATGALHGSVLVFGPGARGDVAPQRVLDGDRLGFGSVTGLDLDSADNLYLSGSDAAAVLVFARGATGSTPAKIRLQGGATRLGTPHGIDVLDDHTIVVADDGPTLNTYAPLVPGPAEAARAAKPKPTKAAKASQASKARAARKVARAKAAKVARHARTWQKAKKAGRR